MKKHIYIFAVLILFACTSSSEIRSLRLSIEDMIICLEQKGLKEFISKHLYPGDIEKMMNNDIGKFIKDLPEDTLTQIPSSLKDTRDKSPEKMFHGKVIRFPGKTTESGYGFIKEQGKWYLINVLVEPSTP